jgi:hypothetical protein
LRENGLEVGNRIKGDPSSAAFRSAETEGNSPPYNLSRRIPAGFFVWFEPV